MRIQSTSIVLAALSANVHGIALPKPSEGDTQEIPQPYWWEGPASASLKEKIYSAPSAIPLPTLKPLVDVSIRTTAVHTQTQVTQPHGSKTPTIYTTVVAPASISYSAPAYQASSILSWSPNKPIYVTPSNAPSIIVQPSQSLAYSAPNSPSPIAPPPAVAYSGLASSIVVAPSAPAVTVAEIQTNQGYTPGVIPSSTPGVIPSYTPGIVLSWTPGIVPSPATSQVLSVPTDQSTVPASSPVSAPQSPSSGPPASGSVIPTTSSPIATSLAPSAVSSIQTSLASVASSLASAASSQVSVSPSAISTPTFQLSTSQAASTSSVPNSSQSILATTSLRSSSANTQGTGIPPAPSAGGSSGSLSARGKERVWWVAFLVPLATLM